MKEKFLLRDLVYIAFLAALTSVLAYFAIPMPGGLPPLTGQSLGVMLAGLLLGAKKGAASQMVYLCLGLLGMPIFANGTAGVGVLAGPTGGFIWGFVAGAFVCGKLTEKNSHATFFFFSRCSRFRRSCCGLFTRNFTAGGCGVCDVDGSCCHDVTFSSRRFN